MMRAVAGVIIIVRCERYRKSVHVPSSSTCSTNQPQNKGEGQQPHVNEHAAAAAAPAHLPRCARTRFSSCPERRHQQVNQPSASPARQQPATVAARAVSGTGPVVAAAAAPPPLGDTASPLPPALPGCCFCCCCSGGRSCLVQSPMSMSHTYTSSMHSQYLGAASIQAAVQRQYASPERVVLAPPTDSKTFNPTSHLTPPSPTLNTHINTSLNPTSHP